MAKASVLEAALTARALGLGAHPGKHAPFLRAVRRAIDFDLVGVDEPDARFPETEVPLLVRRTCPAALREPRGAASRAARSNIAMSSHNSPAR
jgi:hypothetical protein